MSDFDLTTIDAPIATPRQAVTSQPSTTRPPSQVKRAVVSGIAAVAAIGAALGTAEPTGWTPADVFWRAALAVLVCFAASTARRWSLLWLAAVAAAVAGSLVALGLALVGVGFAAWASLRSKHDRVIGAVAGALSAQALVRTPDDLDPALVAAAVVAAVVPVCYSSYRLMRRRHRRKARRIAIAVVVAVGSLALAATFSAMLAREDMTAAVDSMRDGLDAIEAGEDALARASFTEANGMFADAESSLSAPWMTAAQAIPVVAQHVEASQAVAESGTELSSTAAIVANDADYRDLRLARGRVDLQQMAAIAPAVDNAAEALESSAERLAPHRDQLLLPPLADAVEDLAQEIDDTLPETLLAVEALEVLPDMLGADGPRRYLVAVTSPNETRNSGGFLGGYAEITAEDGVVTQTGSGSVTDLNRGGDPAVPRSLDGLDEYLGRYGSYDPATNVQNATASPDLATNARVLTQIYPQAGGAPVDGVVLIDPFGLSALLEITGPIEVPGIGRPLDAENVVPFLLVDQYLEFPDNEDRDAIQADVAAEVFDALLDTTLPGPRKLGESLGPAVEGGHIAMWSFDPDEEEFLERVGLATSFDPGDADFISVRTANAGPNKLDAFLERSISYDVVLDPDSGTFTGDLEVTLANTAPEGLPDYVAGNSELRQGLPGPAAGTNRLFLSVYANGQVDGAELNGSPLSLSSQDELGTTAYVTPLEIPRGEDVTVRYSISGTYGEDDDGTYRLRLSSPPTARTDRLEVTVDATDGFEIVGDPTDDLDPERSLNVVTARVREK